MKKADNRMTISGTKNSQELNEKKADKSSKKPTEES